MSMSCSTMPSAKAQSTAKHPYADRLTRYTCTLGRRGGAGRRHLGHSDWLPVRVEIGRGALDQGCDGAVGGVWEDGRCRGGLRAVAVASRGRGTGAGGRSQLIDIGEAGKARDTVGALGLEAALGGMLLVAGMVGCGGGVTAVAVLDGGGGKGREGGCCRGRSAAVGSNRSVLTM